MGKNKSTHKQIPAHKMTKGDTEAMKILIVSTSDIQGGAAIAAYRLMQALNQNGMDVRMMVRVKQTDDERVVKIGSKWRDRWNFVFERAYIFLRNGLSRKYLFDVSVANTGHSIVNTKEFREADIIHLHWINQGMLSLKEIGRILQSGKKIVWTMHDLWAVTGICHHTQVHSRDEETYSLCPYFGKRLNRLSRRIYMRKQQTYYLGHITFVACSRWLEALAADSPLTVHNRVLAIPNPIDTHQYAAADKAVVREKLNLPKENKYILYAAAKVSDKRKGLDYLLEASRILAQSGRDVTFLIAGAEGSFVVNEMWCRAIDLGYVPFEKMADYYRAADVFLTASLQENLPNTIMEAMACGTPCVGFNVGGIPEMIDHLENGYVAEYKSADDLARGIEWVLFEGDYSEMAHLAREKVLSEYAQSAVAARYIEVYGQLLEEE